MSKTLDFSHLVEGVKGCSLTNLRKFRRFPLSSPEILQTLSAKSPEDTEIRQAPSVESLLTPAGDTANAPAFIGKRVRPRLVPLRHPPDNDNDNAEAQRLYKIEATHNGWGARELERQIASSLYERLALSRDKAAVRQLARKGQVIEKASDLIKNPLVLEFLGLEQRPAYSESDLETAIIDRLQQLLQEFGKGFLFEARHKRFFYRLLRCHLLIDLKRGEMTHQEVGQMQMYVNYFDRYIKNEDELPTVGIVLCGTKNDAVVELTLPEDASIYAFRHQLYLPSKQEVAAQLKIGRKEFGDRDGSDGE